MSPNPTKLLINPEKIAEDFIESAKPFDQMEDKECRHSIEFPTLTLWFDKHPNKTNEESMREIVNKLDFATFRHEDHVIKTWDWMRRRGYNTDIKVKRFGWRILDYIGRLLTVKMMMATAKRD